MDVDADLLAAAAHGDAGAFDRFYRRHLSMVVSFSRRAVGDPELAADLTAEVFAAALASCGRYRPDHPTAGPWLLGIANNKLRESLRRGRVQDNVRRRLGMQPLVIDDERLQRVEELAALGTDGLAAAFAALPPDEREAIQARVIDERDYHDIATSLECSRSVVRQRVSRGLARMRAQIAARPNTENRR
jgi:RNA polymerase sigma-70 factor (ECF subfamily)